MKDLSEAELIEIEQDALYLFNLLDYEPDEMPRNQLNDKWDEAHEYAERLHEQITNLCELARRRALERAA